MNEWQSVKQPPEIGALVRLKFRDYLGEWEGDADCFLHDDGAFYLVKPPTMIRGPVTAWRPAKEADAHG